MVANPVLCDPGTLRVQLQESNGLLETGRLRAVDDRDQGQCEQCVDAGRYTFVRFLTTFWVVGGLVGGSNRTALRFPFDFCCLHPRDAPRKLLARKLAFFKISEQISLHFVKLARFFGLFRVKDDFRVSPVEQKWGQTEFLLKYEMGHTNAPRRLSGSG